MADRMLVPAETPGGETVVVSVVDLDGTAVAGGEQKAEGSVTVTMEWGKDT